MARVIYTPQVGHCIYRPYEATNPALVLEVVHLAAKVPGDRAHRVRVRLLNGTDDVWVGSSFQDYDHLVKEAERKAANHRQRLDALRAGSPPRPVEVESAAPAPSGPTAVTLVRARDLTDLVGGGGR
jgi:hypothetical protein